METSSNQKFVNPLTNLKYVLPLYSNFSLSYNGCISYLHMPSLNVVHPQCNDNKLAYSL